MISDNLIAPFTLKLNDAGILEEAHGKKFDMSAYSRMKYGVRSELQNFAKLLAHELYIKAPHVYSSVKPPAILTSYKAAAPPATTLARYCLDIINLERFKSGLNSGEMVRVYRPNDYIEEYATLPESERKKLLGSQVDNSLQGRNLKSYIPIILDDIYVTGSYTAMMKNILKDYEDVLTVYIAVCDASVSAKANAESILNLTHIKTPKDVLPFIKKNDFVFTRRFLKMLLRSDLSELSLVIKDLPDTLLEQITRGIIDTDPELQNIFPETCKLLLSTISENRELNA